MSKCLLVHSEMFICFTNYFKIVRIIHLSLVTNELSALRLSLNNFYPWVFNHFNQCVIDTKDILDEIKPFNNGIHYENEVEHSTL